MLRRSLFLILTLLFLLVKKADAESFQRETTLEWDQTASAIAYDIEIRSKQNNKASYHKVTTETWTGKLEPGNYLLRVRSRDHRNVPGEWSQAEEFAVMLNTPNQISPTVSSELKSSEENEDKIELSWNKVALAENYHINIWSTDKKIKQTHKTRSTSLKVSLPVATKYQWSVTAESANKIQSETPAEGHFTLLGKKLGKPEIKEPKNDFVRLLEWSKPKLTQHFNLTLSRYDEDKQKWVVVGKRNNLTANRIPFSEKYPGGQYKLSVTAAAPLRESSEVEELIFDAAAGSRSPAAEQVAAVRQSIERTKGWFGVASYLITMIQYQGSNWDLNAEIPTGFATPVLAGTGRLGVGYLSHKSDWGFLSILDYSGFKVEGTIYNYGSLEVSSVHRMKRGDRGEIRQHFGLFYRDFPFFVPQGFGGNSTYSAGAAIGPHYGFEYWQAISEKLGFQANFHIYMNMLTISSPNAYSLDADSSYQLGFLGSYRLSEKATGLMGYAYKSDRFSYRSTGTSGNLNSATITGHYLNFFLEWAL